MQSWSWSSSPPSWSCPHGMWWGTVVACWLELMCADKKFGKKLGHCRTNGGEFKWNDFYWETLTISQGWCHDGFYQTCLENVPKSGIYLRFPSNCGGDWKSSVNILTCMNFINFLWVDFPSLIIIFQKTMFLNFLHNITQTWINVVMSWSKPKYNCIVLSRSVL